MTCGTASSRNVGTSLVTVLLVGLVLTVGAQDPPPRSPVQLQSQGIFALQKQDFTAARAIFTELLALTPDHANGHYYLAACHAQLGSDLEAAQHLGEAQALGFPLDPAELAANPYFASCVAASSEPWRLLLASIERRNQGNMQGLSFHYRLQDETGAVHEPSRYRGRAVLVAFLELKSANSLGVAYLLEKLASEDPTLATLGIVQVLAKDDLQQVELLDKYRQSAHLKLPLLIEQPGITAQLRPFRGYPTVLVIDREGNPVRALEGKTELLEQRLRVALDKLAPATPPQPTTRPGQE